MAEEDVIMNESPTKVEIQLNGFDLENENQDFSDVSLETQSNGIPLSSSLNKMSLFEDHSSPIPNGKQDMDAMNVDDYEEKKERNEEKEMKVEKKFAKEDEKEAEKEAGIGRTEYIVIENHVNTQDLSSPSSFSSSLSSISSFSAPLSTISSSSSIPASSSSATSTPSVSRRELLDIVRKHSDELPRPKSGEDMMVIEPSVGVQMDDRYWREMMDMYFVRGYKTTVDFNENSLFDDMLFFVRKQRSTIGQIINFFGNYLSMEENSEENSEDAKMKNFFVRRWNTDLLKVIGESLNEVDWRRSYYLNLICHTNYTLTVAICSRQALEAHKRDPSGSPVQPICKITKKVYASPSRARIDIDILKSTETISAYPDICFAIDDYEDLFEAVVLSENDHCFCVMLNATGGAPFPTEEIYPDPEGMVRTHHRRSSSEAVALGEASDGDLKVTLFSGFVSYSMVKSAFHGGKARFSLFTQEPMKTERLIMRGPGGRGEADVAVSGILESIPKPIAPKPPRPSPPGSLTTKRLQDLRTKLCAVQEELAILVKQQVNRQSDQVNCDEHERVKVEQLYQERLKRLQLQLASVQSQLQDLHQKENELSPSSSPPYPSSPLVNGIGNFVRRATKGMTYPSNPVQLIPLRCCLISLTLPWDSLAYDLLFKEMPIKVEISGRISPHIPSFNHSED